MKTKANPAAVGGFVLGALVLALIALLSFGGINFFNKPQRFVVQFDESVHGLDQGSPVKLRGVRVGRVTGIRLRYSPKDNRSLVEVECEFNRDVIIDPSGQPLDVSDRARLQQLVDQGMSAQLGVIGLATGLLFVELDFRPGEKPEARPWVVSEDRVIVPAIPSAISEFQASFTEILANIKGIDFAGIAHDLQGLLVDSRRQLNDLKTKELVQAWTDAGHSVNQLATSPQLAQALISLNQAATDLSTKLAKVDDAELAKTITDARKALEAFSSTSSTLREFINAQQGLGTDTRRALGKLSTAAEAVERLADFLERNPRALLSGRTPPPANE